MSAYSAEMLEAWRTVTLKVNVLPIFRWDRAFWGDKSSGRSRLRSELLAGLLGVSKEAASNTLWDYFLTNLRPHLLLSLLTIKNMNIISVVSRIFQAVTHLDRCCCWPHPQRFQYLHSVLLPQRCAAPPERCWSGRVHQDTNLSGTGPRAKLSQHAKNQIFQTFAMTEAITSLFFFIRLLLIIKDSDGTKQWRRHLLKLFIFKGDLGCAWLPHAGAVVRGLFIS